MTPGRVTSKPELMQRNIGPVFQTILHNAVVEVEGCHPPYLRTNNPLLHRGLKLADWPGHSAEKQGSS